MTVRSVNWAVASCACILAHSGPGAAEAPVRQEFRFECPELSAELAAEVEGRSRVEAEIHHLESFQVHFGCTPLELSVKIASLAKDERVRSVSVPRDERPLEAALVDLFVEALGSATEHPEAEHPELGPLKASRAEPGGVETAPPPLPDVPQAERLRPETARPVGERQRQETVVAGQTAKHREVTEDVPLNRFYVDAFAVYESLGADAAGVIGGGAAGLFRLSPGFVLGPVGRIGQALDAPLDITSVTFGLELEWTALRVVTFAAGPQLSIQYFSAPELRASGNDTAVGAFLGGNFLWGPESAAFRAGASLTWVPNERIIRAAGDELMRIPPLGVELHVGGRFGL